MKKLIGYIVLGMIVVAGCQSANAGADKDAEIADLKQQVEEQQEIIEGLENEQQTFTIEYELVDKAEGPGPTEWYFYAEEGLLLHGDEVPADTEIGQMVQVTFEVGTEDVVKVR